MQQLVKPGKRDGAVYEVHVVGQPALAKQPRSGCQAQEINIRERLSLPMPSPHDFARVFHALQAGLRKRQHLVLVKRQIRVERGSTDQTGAGVL